MRRRFRFKLDVEVYGTDEEAVARGVEAFLSDPKDSGEGNGFGWKVKRLVRTSPPEGASAYASRRTAS